MKTRSSAFLTIAIMITLLTNKCSTKKSLLWQEILIIFLSVPQPLNQFDGTFHGLKITNWSITWHGNCLLTWFDFSIINLLFWILLCYLLNVLLFCIGIISWCCFVVTLFRRSSHVRLFRGIPIVMQVFGCMFRQCSANAPMFRRCSVFRNSVFWCS